MNIEKNETFGLIKTILDAHTMGVHAAAALLRDCGYQVLIAPPEIEDALDKVSARSSQRLIKNWLLTNNVKHIGVSYRLDPDDAVNIVGRLVEMLKRERLFEVPNAAVKSVFFAGLAPACKQIDKDYMGLIKTFCGGESAEETLRNMGVPEKDIPHHIIEGCKYDKELLKFGQEIIRDGTYPSLKPLTRIKYPAFGTKKDTLEARLAHNFEGGFQPLIRAHSGPYSAEMTRVQCLHEYNDWCKKLAESGYLDILSIGSSQLSQSNFGEEWKDKPNGGGVPVNSEKEFHDIWKAAQPMLVRTYSGTKNVLYMADMYERTINISWHALSLWWFNELDGRGPNSLYQNLKEHIATIRHIAQIGKPVETNVPHHFAFRGCDDVTYIVSAFLAAKMAKMCGVRTFILQNMLNTPRSTWGIQDLAKSRAMLHLVKSLENDNFRVILQTRAGLDYFKPDIDEAKVQLAAVTAMMDDIDPENIYSPEIIHVVSYSEALFLATPEIIDDSIKITRKALQEYRKKKQAGETPNVNTPDIQNRTVRLMDSAKKIIAAMEQSIPNLYSPEGLYVAFVAGWLPVPELWSNSNEFLHAKCWETKMHNGGIELVDHDLLMTTESRISRCLDFMKDAEDMLCQKYLDKQKGI